jgi:hypothetical protein
MKKILKFMQGMLFLISIPFITFISLLYISAILFWWAIIPGIMIMINSNLLPYALMVFLFELMFCIGLGVLK